MYRNSRERKDQTSSTQFGIYATTTTIAVGVFAYLVLQFADYVDELTVPCQHSTDIVDGKCSCTGTPFTGEYCQTDGCVNGVVGDVAITTPFVKTTYGCRCTGNWWGYLCDVCTSKLCTLKSDCIDSENIGSLYYGNRCSQYCSANLTRNNRYFSDHPDSLEYRRIENNGGKAVHCSGHGDCSDTGCICDEDYHPSSDGVSSCEATCASVNASRPEETKCNKPYGSCVQENGLTFCACKDGYVGEACQYNCPNSCSGAGICVFKEGGVGVECQCDEGFVSEDCSQQCPSSGGFTCSGHGQCSAGEVEASCSCTGGWTLDDCSCNPDLTCSGHGTCTAAGCACSGNFDGGSCNFCKPTFLGDDCQFECTADLCNEGVCAVEDNTLVCKCPYGFDSATNCAVCEPNFYPLNTLEDRCSEYIDNSTCYNHGQPNNLYDLTNNRCICNTNFNPDTDCNTCIENFYPEGTCNVECTADTCKNGGTCDIETGLCNCPEGYAGPTCMDTCAEGCNNGRCVVNDLVGTIAKSCVCDENYYGAQCDITCPLGPNTGDICNAAGTCSAKKLPIASAQCEEDSQCNQFSASYGNSHCHKPMTPVRVENIIMGCTGQIVLDAYDPLEVGTTDPFYYLNADDKYIYPVFHSLANNILTLQSIVEDDKTLFIMDMLNYSVVYHDQLECKNIVGDRSCDLVPGCTWTDEFCDFEMQGVDQFAWCNGVLSYENIEECATIDTKDCDVSLCADSMSVNTDCLGNASTIIEKWEKYHFENNALVQPSLMLSPEKDPFTLNVTGNMPVLCTDIENLPWVHRTFPNITSDVPVDDTTIINFEGFQVCEDTVNTWEQALEIKSEHCLIEPANDAEFSTRMRPRDMCASVREMTQQTFAFCAPLFGGHQRTASVQTYHSSGKYVEFWYNSPTNVVTGPRIIFRDANNASVTSLMIDSSVHLNTRSEIVAHCPLTEPNCNRLIARNVWYFVRLIFDENNVTLEMDNADDLSATAGNWSFFEIVGLSDESIHNLIVYDDETCAPLYRKAELPYGVTSQADAVTLCARYEALNEPHPTFDFEEYCNFTKTLTGTTDFTSRNDAQQCANVLDQNTCGDHLSQVCTELGVDAQSKVDYCDTRLNFYPHKDDRVGVPPDVSDRCQFTSTEWKDHCTDLKDNNLTGTCSVAMCDCNYNQQYALGGDACHLTCPMHDPTQTPCGIGAGLGRCVERENALETADTTQGECTCTFPDADPDRGCFVECRNANCNLNETERITVRAFECTLPNSKFATTFVRRAGFCVENITGTDECECEDCAGYVDLGDGNCTSCTQITDGNDIVFERTPLQLGEVALTSEECDNITVELRSDVCYVSRDSLILKEFDESQYISELETDILDREAELDQLRAYLLSLPSSPYDPPYSQRICNTSELETSESVCTAYKNAYDTWNAQTFTEWSCLEYTHPYYYYPENLVSETSWISGDWSYTDCVNKANEEGAEAFIYYGDPPESNHYNPHFCLRLSTTTMRLQYQNSITLSEQNSLADTGAIIHPKYCFKGAQEWLSVFRLQRDCLKNYCENAEFDLGPFPLQTREDDDPNEIVEQACTEITPCDRCGGTCQDDSMCAPGLLCEKHFLPRPDASPNTDGSRWVGDEYAQRNISEDKAPNIDTPMLSQCSHKTRANKSFGFSYCYDPKQTVASDWNFHRHTPLFALEHNAYIALESIYSGLENDYSLKNTSYSPEIRSIVPYNERQNVSAILSRPMLFSVILSESFQCSNPQYGKQWSFRSANDCNVGRNRLRIPQCEIVFTAGSCNSGTGQCICETPLSTTRIDTEIQLFGAVIRDQIDITFGNHKRLNMMQGLGAYLKHHVRYNGEKILEVNDAIREQFRRNVGSDMFQCDNPTYARPHEYCDVFEQLMCTEGYACIQHMCQESDVSDDIEEVYDNMRSQKQATISTQETLVAQLLAEEELLSWNADSFVDGLSGSVAEDEKAAYDGQRICNAEEIATSQAFCQVYKEAYDAFTSQSFSTADWSCLENTTVSYAHPIDFINENSWECENCSETECATLVLTEGATSAIFLDPEPRLTTVSEESEVNRLRGIGIDGWETYTSSGRYDFIPEIRNCDTSDLEASESICTAYKNAYNTWNAVTFLEWSCLNNTMPRFYYPQDFVDPDSYISGQITQEECFNLANEEGAEAIVWFGDPPGNNNENTCWRMSTTMRMYFQNHPTTAASMFSSEGWEGFNPITQVNYCFKGAQEWLSVFRLQRDCLKNYCENAEFDLGPFPLQTREDDDPNEIVEQACTEITPCDSCGGACFDDSMCAPGLLCEQDYMGGEELGRVYSPDPGGTKWFGDEYGDRVDWALRGPNIDTPMLAQCSHKPRAIKSVGYSESVGFPYCYDPKQIVPGDWNYKRHHRIRHTCFRMNRFQEILELTNPTGTSESQRAVYSDLQRTTLVTEDGSAFPSTKYCFSGATAWQSLFETAKDCRENYCENTDYDLGPFEIDTRPSKTNTQVNDPCTEITPCGLCGGRCWNDYQCAPGLLCETSDQGHPNRLSRVTLRDPGEFGAEISPLPFVWHTSSSSMYNGYSSIPMLAQCSHKTRETITSSYDMGYCYDPKQIVASDWIYARHHPLRTSIYNAQIQLQALREELELFFVNSQIFNSAHCSYDNMIRATLSKRSPWSGMDCDNKCPGTYGGDFPDDYLGCSGHGSCTRGTCNCDYASTLVQYVKGERIENPVTGEISDYQRATMSTNAMTGWRGVACEKQCPGYNVKTFDHGESCSGHGECTQNARCICESGWVGREDNGCTLQCPTSEEAPLNECSSHGTCEIQQIGPEFSDTVVNTRESNAGLLSAFENKCTDDFWVEMMSSSLFSNDGSLPVGNYTSKDKYYASARFEWGGTYRADFTIQFGNNHAYTFSVNETHISLPSGSIPITNRIFVEMDEHVWKIGIDLNGPSVVYRDVVTVSYPFTFNANVRLGNVDNLRLGVGVWDGTVNHDPEVVLAMLQPIQSCDDIGWSTKGTTASSQFMCEYGSVNCTIRYLDPTTFNCQRGNIFTVDSTCHHSIKNAFTWKRPTVNIIQSYNDNTDTEKQFIQIASVYANLNYKLATCRCLTGWSGFDCNTCERGLGGSTCMRECSRTQGEICANRGICQWGSFDGNGEDFFDASCVCGRYEYDNMFFAIDKAGLSIFEGDTWIFRRITGELTGPVDIIADSETNFLGGANSETCECVEGWVGGHCHKKTPSCLFGGAPDEEFCLCKESGQAYELQSDQGCCPPGFVFDLTVSFLPTWYTDEMVFFSNFQDFYNDNIYPNKIMDRCINAMYQRDGSGIMSYTDAWNSGKTHCNGNNAVPLDSLTPVSITYVGTVYASECEACTNTKLCGLGMQCVESTGSGSIPGCAGDTAGMSYCTRGSYRCEGFIYPFCEEFDTGPIYKTIDAPHFVDVYTDYTTPCRTCNRFSPRGSPCVCDDGYIFVEQNRRLVDTGYTKEIELLVALALANSAVQFTSEMIIAREAWRPYWTERIPRETGHWTNDPNYYPNDPPLPEDPDDPSRYYFHTTSRKWTCPGSIPVSTYHTKLLNAYNAYENLRGPFSQDMAGDGSNCLTAVTASFYDWEIERTGSNVQTDTFMECVEIAKDEGAMSLYWDGNEKWCNRFSTSIPNIHSFAGGISHFYFGGEDTGISGIDDKYSNGEWARVLCFRGAIQWYKYMMPDNIYSSKINTYTGGNAFLYNWARCDNYNPVVLPSRIRETRPISTNACTNTNPCGLCGGDCYNDLQCKPGLRCEWSVRQRQLESHGDNQGAIFSWLQGGEAVNGFINSYYGGQEPQGTINGNTGNQGYYPMLEQCGGASAVRYQITHPSGYRDPGSPTGHCYDPNLLEENDWIYWKHNDMDDGGLETRLTAETQHRDDLESAQPATPHSQTMLDSNNFFYASHEKSTVNTCDKCAPGLRLTEGGTQTKTCIECNPGEFGEEFNLQYNCPGCPGGWAQPSAGQTSCEQCPPAKYSGYSFPNCIDCPSGWQQPLSGQMQCEGCPEGFSQTVTTGSITCTPCAPGTFTDQPSLPTCKTCPDGYTKPTVYPRTFCNACPSGKYSTAFTLTTTCTTCPGGKYSDADGSTECKTCPRGSYSDSTISCKICPAGYYASSADSSVCTACQPGYYGQNKEGGNNPGSCTSCNVGRYQDEFAKVYEVWGNEGYYCDNTHFQRQPGCVWRCNLCPPGKYSDQLGSSECKCCTLFSYQDGTYASITGPTECKYCASAYGSVIDECRSTGCRL